VKPSIDAADRPGIESRLAGILHRSLDRALILYEQGRLPETETLCREILAANPRSSTAAHLLGLVCVQRGRPEEAAEHLLAASLLEPANPAVLLNYANALGAVGQVDEAVRQLDLALKIDANHAQAWNSRGACLWRLQKFDQALLSYERALAISPRDPGFLCNIGLCLSSLKRFADAVVHFDRALALDPNCADALRKRSHALQALGRYGDALASIRTALLIEPDNTDAALGHGALLAQGNRHEEAIDCFNAVLHRLPADATALNLRGISLRALNRGAQALASYNQALKAQPDFADALINRANLCWEDNDDPQRAIADLSRVVSLQPEWPYMRGTIAHLKMHCADWRDFDRDRAFVRDGIKKGRQVIRPFDYQAISDCPGELQSCARIFTADQFPGVSPPFKANRAGHGKIRLGYMSGEFREQATAYLMAGVYELHDRDKFELLAIDNAGGDGSPMRARLENAFDEIVSINGLTDSEAADLVRSKEIDILVNLNGYFGRWRMGVCANRAAPIQVNYLGFPGTLGASYIDYIIADRIVIPEAERRYYDEAVVYLPGSYQANDSRRGIAPQRMTRDQAGLPQDGFVFCNFNQSYKLTPETFSTWMQIVGQAERSVLWLLEGPRPFQENLRREAERHGVSADRIIFANAMPADQHLARIALADLFLDSLPYNGHTTASDALWAGLPLLTRRGSSFPGRVAASLLSSLGVPELIAESNDDFIASALAMARDRAFYLSLRARVAAARASSPLFDTGTFTRSLEAAYATMFDRYRDGRPPDGFSVTAER
jgi:protein O-GlcNAc transferase